MKRIPVLISAVLLLLFAAALPVSAEGGASDTTTIGASIPHVEGGSYLTADENAELELLAKKTSEKVNAGIYVVFSGAEIANIELEASSILKSKISAGGGYGDNHDAIILYVNMKDRTYAIEEDGDSHDNRLTGKFVNKELADDAKIRSLLGKDEYFNAAKTFINDVEGELNPNIFKALWWRILAALGIGGGVTGIAAGSHKALKKTKKRHYLKDNRINVLEKNERLTGTDVSRNVTKQPKTSGTDHEIGSGHGGSNTF